METARFSPTPGESRKVGMGAAGDPAYCDDIPLNGAMGFVRKSEKKSGLTRKKKTP